MPWYGSHDYLTEYIRLYKCLKIMEIGVYDGDNARAKGSDPMIFKISSKLMNMLLNIRRRAKLKDQRRIFANDLRTIRRVFERQRANIARKLQNPRILQIHFHTFRHWNGTILYHRTKDVLYVMRRLGHRNIKNTLTYIQLEEAIFKDQEDAYVCRVAKSVEEASGPVESGFEYVCDFDDSRLFRKRK